MKKTYFLFFAFWVSASVFATSIDVNHAMKVAQNFYQQQTTDKTVTLTLAYQSLNQDGTNGLPVGEPLYYVFDVNRGRGFVMVSADDVAKPILGYSTNRPFIIQNAPSVITDWFEKYNKQIAHATNHTLATGTIADQWNNYTNNIITGRLKSTPVAPLLTTGWNQSQFYNDLCPLDGQSTNDGYGGRCPTGCGATAMAQIMRYWSYPTQGTSSHSYTSNYGDLSANFGATTYNWANMPSYVTSSNTDVATLMYDCGVAVEMIYGPNGSSSHMTGSAPSCYDAYSTYFGYDPNTIQGKLKSDYPNEADWINLIETELNAGRPIQYAGSDPVQGGHTFVLDGEDANGLFDINWGWGGQDNNYYAIDALDPPVQQETFNLYEAMLIGIKPLNLISNTSNIQLYSNITVNPDPIGFHQTFSVNADVINDGSDFNGDYCAALFDVTGTFIRYIGPILGTNGTALPSGSHYNGGLTFSDTTTAVTLPGSYNIGVYYQPTGVNTWTLAGTTAYANPISVTIGGPQNAPGDSIELYSNITVTPSVLIQGQGASVNVNLANISSGTFFGQYEAALLDFSGSVVEELIGTYTESNGLPAQSDYLSPYITFSTGNITVGEGQYILAIAENQSGVGSWYYCGGQSYTNPILVNVVNPAFFTSIKEPASSNIRLYPNPASNLINIDAGEVRGSYSLKIFNIIGQEMSGGNGFLDGQNISVDLSSFTPGVYIIQLKTGTANLNAQFIVK